MAKVEVCVEVPLYIRFQLCVKDPEDLDEVKQKLLQKDPLSDGEFEEDYHKYITANFEYFVSRIEKDDVELIEE